LDCHRRLGRQVIAPTLARGVIGDSRRRGDGGPFLLACRLAPLDQATRGLRDGSIMTNIVNASFDDRPRTHDVRGITAYIETSSKYIDARSYACGYPVNDMATTRRCSELEGIGDVEVIEHL